MFLLGVGAQKAGTTWLWRQLSKHPLYRNLGKKELHYWDKLLRLDSKNLRDEELIHSFMTDESVEFVTSRNRHRYFDPIQRAQAVSHGKHQTQPMVADITPAYAGLPRGVFRLIREELESRDVDYRVIYFMRDPVARIVSAFKMGKRRRKQTPLQVLQNAVWNRTLDEELIRFGRSWGCQYRTRYEITVANLRVVFPADRLFFGFTESISDPQQIADLSEFLDLPSSLFNPLQRPNRAPVNQRIAPSTIARQELSHLYLSTYQGIIGQFREARGLWATSHRADSEPTV
jgi:hypothetical protein